MDIKNKKILIISPHTDDAELGMGATINKLVENNDIYSVAFSSAPNTTKEGVINDKLMKEHFSSLNILGVNIDNIFLHEFQTREFRNNTSRILDLLIFYRDSIKPDIVFIPQSTDIHQDHITIHQESLRAFKFQTILGYELAWNIKLFKKDLFISISRNNLYQKTQCLKEYYSQKDKKYFNSEFIGSNAVVNGVISNNHFAESFEVIKINI